MNDLNVRNQLKSHIKAVKGETFYDPVQSHKIVWCSSGDGIDYARSHREVCVLYVQ